jgi:amidohydrolase
MSISLHNKLTPAEQAMMAAVDGNEAVINEIAKKIWEYRETGLEEFKSSALLTDILEKEGFTVRRGMTGKDISNGVDVDMPTAFTAVFEGKGKKGKGVTVGLLLEYDAMPHGHACGHNLIASSGYAAAIGIREALKTMPGTLVVYGCPAEETRPAKQYMYDAGVMDGVDVMYTAHASGDAPGYWSTELRCKSLMSTMPGEGLVFTGHPAHASASPWDGRSALDAVMLTGMGLEFLREHILETDRTHYIVLHGGVAANIVPEKAAMDVWVRANDTKRLNALKTRVENIFKGAALMTETSYEFKWNSPTLSAVPVPALYRHGADAGVALGIKEESFAFNTSFQGSTDAGNVGYQIPTCFVAFPVSTDYITGHSDGFTAASNTDYGRNNAIMAGKIMALSAYRLMTEKNALQAIKAEFEANKNK